MVALRNLLGLFPAALLLVLVVLLTNGLISVIVRRLSPAPLKRPVGMEQLAASMELDADRLKHWQSGRILLVEHGQHGRVTDVRVVR